MKIRSINLVAGVFILFAGCATAPDNASDIAVRVGMSRNELKAVYGDPLRIESTPYGGQDWYYHFYSWAKGPTVSVSETTDANGYPTTSTSEGWQVEKGPIDEPIHLSPQGYVVGPLPSGKVLKN